jgi:anaerobic selenocysteine-containing dehydrogenase
MTGQPDQSRHDHGEQGPVFQSSPSVCRVCHNLCGIRVDTEDGRVVRITGDNDNPLFHGYTCVKGRSHAGLYEHPERLLRPMKRRPDGTFAPIPLADAIGEIAARIEAIIDRHGSRAVAMYRGTSVGFEHAANVVMTDAFMRAIGSPMLFDTYTIDQPGKFLAKAHHGNWMAPNHAVHQPDVALIVGNNPLVSHQGVFGNPGDHFRDLARRGGKVIVIDPRVTETAKRATIHLQIRPGEDAAVLAAMVQVILAEGRYDIPFVAENATGVDALRNAVGPFTAEVAAHRADVLEEDIVAAARMFAAARRGYGCVGTGANMSGDGTLVEYLVLCLDTLCGHWLRAGERVANAITIHPAAAHPPKAQALPPYPAADGSDKLRVRALGRCVVGLPTAALADEILLEGEGQIRGLLCLQANPLVAWPDQLKTIDALRSLELLVQTDVRLWPATQFAHYVIAPTLPLEMSGTTLAQDFAGAATNNVSVPASYAQYTPAIVEPPADAEVIEQWALLCRLAQALGRKLEVHAGFGPLGPDDVPVSLDMSCVPASDELLDIVHAGSRVPLEEVKRHPHGAFFPDPVVYVEPRDPDWQGRLDLANAEMVASLGRVAGGWQDPDEEFPYRLIGRRMMHVYNSPTPATPANRPPYNPAFMHPGDLEELDVADGDVVTIRSARASILGVVRSDTTVRRGVVSMSHCYGDVPERDEDVRTAGSPTTRLLANDVEYDRYSGQPRMSNIPIRVEPRRVHQPKLTAETNDNSPERPLM